MTLPTSIRSSSLIVSVSYRRGKLLTDLCTQDSTPCTCDAPPRFYGLPKVHKKDTPLRPIVSSIGTITYNHAQYLAQILSPLVGKTEHHVKNSEEFAKKIRELCVE